MSKNSGVREADEARRAQKLRNVVIALALLGFVALIFVITIVRLSQNIAAGVS